MHEQTVEIALGPKGAFANGRVGTLKWRVTADRVVNVAAKARRPAKPPKQPQTPRVVELLRQAQEWRRQLDVGEDRTQAEIARNEGVTRARVTQVLGLLRIAPEMQERILRMAEVDRRPMITERAIRYVLQVQEPADRNARLEQLLAQPE